MTAPDAPVYGHALTDFQRLMRQWSARAPYNAAHVMHVSGAPDLHRWREAIAHATRPLGFDGQTIPLELSSVWLEQQITNELNRSFAPEAFPLRAFVLHDTATTHWFGITFDHWFADSRSMRALMRRMFARYSSREPELPPLSVAARIQPAADGALARLSALSSSFRNYWWHRRAVRISMRDPTDFDSGFLVKELPAGTLARVRAVAEAAGATVNDVFVAAAAQVLGVRTAEQRGRNRQGTSLLPPRDRVAIAAAVDLRGSKPDDDRDAFGFALSYFSVILDEPEHTPLPALAAAVAAQTRRGKGAARASQFDLNLRAAGWLWERRSDPYSQARLFSRAMPLVAGISNVNLSGTWSDQQPAGDGPAVLDYLRVSPVGPLLPMVFTVTTIGERLSLCFTYRTAAFKRDVAQELTAAFIQRLGAGV